MGKGFRKGEAGKKGWVTKPAVYLGNSAKRSLGSIPSEGRGNWSLNARESLVEGCWEGRTGRVVHAGLACHAGLSADPGTKPSGRDAGAAFGNELPESLRHLPHSLSTPEMPVNFFSTAVFTFLLLTNLDL